MFVQDTLLDAILRGLILSSIALILVVVLIRINGLRSLSKMTNFDFVMTIALGSLVASGSQVTEWNAYLQIAAALVGLFALQFTAGLVRRSSDSAEAIMQNEPILLMRNGKFIDEAMARTRVTRADVIAKLREANALDYGKVRAVVLETTGDVSVLHGDTLDEHLIEDVRDLTNSG